MPKINLDSGLYDRAQQVAKIAGYSSVDEFISRCVEKELSKLDLDKSEAQVADQLRGLGYIE
jgi:hypothetical protein